MTSLSRVALAAALSLLAFTPAMGADNYTITSGGASRTLRAKDIGAGVLAPMSIAIDGAGTERFTAANPGYIVLPSGAVLAISASALPLPAGAATDAKLEAVRALLAAPVLPTGGATDAKLEALRLLLAGTLTTGLPAGAATDAKAEAIRALLAGTLTVSLPAGAATSAAQGTSNTSLASIDGKLPAKGAAAAAGSMPVTIATDQPAVPTDTIVRSTAVNRGAVLTTAGTAQTLVPANASRRGLAIQNRNAPGSSYSAATSVFMSCQATATQDFNSLEIPAGALYETPGHHTGTGACSFVSATANTPVYVREF